MSNLSWYQSDDGTEQYTATITSLFFIAKLHVALSEQDPSIYYVRCKLYLTGTEDDPTDLLPRIYTLSSSVEGDRDTAMRQCKELAISMNTIITDSINSLTQQLVSK